MLKWLAPVSAGAMIVLVSCTSGTGTPTAPSGGTPSGSGSVPSFQTQVAPLLAQSCASCHMPGTAGARDLTIADAAGKVSYSAAKAKSVSMLREVMRGSMPKGGPKWSSAQVDLLSQWQAAGAPDN